MSGATATPLLLVIAVIVVALPVKVPLALVVDAIVNVTVAPLTGLFEASVTLACSAVAKSVATLADWLSPALTTILAGTAGLLMKTSRLLLRSPGTGATSEARPSQTVVLPSALRSVGA